VSCVPDELSCGADTVSTGHDEVSASSDELPGVADAVPAGIHDVSADADTVRGRNRGDAVSVGAHAMPRAGDPLPGGGHQVPGRDDALPGESDGVPGPAYALPDVPNVVLRWQRLFAGIARFPLRSANGGAGGSDRHGKDSASDTGAVAGAGVKKWKS